MTRGVLIVNGELDGVAGACVRTRAGVVVETGGRLAADGDAIIDAAGGAIIPGLHDHHVHLRAAVAARRSVALDPSSVAAAGGFATALAAAARRVASGEWIRGVGAYGPEVETMDRYALDALVADHPVRVQHRGGALWLLNSAAVSRLAVAHWSEDGVERFPDGTPTGRLWRLDKRLRDALGSADDDQSSDQGSGLAELSAEALTFGITGFTDATADRSPEDVTDLAEQVAAGRIRQRLTLMADPALRVPPPGVSLGPRKIVLDDDRLPTPEELGALVTATHAAQVAVAVHCVTAEQLVVTVAAFQVAGTLPGDRIEHAGVVPPGYANQLTELGITVITQPGFLAARGDDYLRDVSAPERDWLYPVGSLLAAGVAVAAGSDAPFGPLDPWLALRTAVTRSTASGAVVGIGERVDARQALRLFLGRADAPGVPRRVAAGEPGQLCLLRAPLADALADPGAHQVGAVVIDDEVIACNP